jgi:RND family efflux transporter MFP subunit
MVAVLAGLGAMLLAGCSPDAAPTATEAALPVSLHRVGDKAFGVSRHATGTVRLRRETPLAFLSDGRVQTVSVREGDVVGGGQLLATLDPTAVNAAAASADARARQASAELQRQRELYKRGWISKARVESAEAAAEATRADQSSTQFSQRFSRIHAPAAGVVLARSAEPGQTMAAGTPILTLGEFASGFVLRVPMGAGQAAGLDVGQMANVRFRDNAAPEMAARIIEIAGRADPATGTFRVEFALPANAALRSGLIADVELPAAQGQSRLLIPATALFSARADEGFVWRYDPARRSVQPQMVRLGQVSGEGVEVQSGLARGDVIVASGVDRLVAGQKVQPVATGTPNAAKGAGRAS